MGGRSNEHIDSLVPLVSLVSFMIPENDILVVFPEAISYSSSNLGSGYLEPFFLVLCLASYT